MQSVSTSLQTALDLGQVDPRVLIDLYELYDSADTPGATGFDPADALETFAAQEITWNGIAYRRELKGRSDIVRSMGEKLNNVTLNFSNISRYMATLAQSSDMEGMILVIRTVAPSVTDDSIVLFTGRLGKPSDVDKKDFSITAEQYFGDINVLVPPRKFEAEDPEGRVVSDPLFEGIDLLAIGGSFSFPQVVASDSLFGRLLGRRRTISVTQQWSSVDATPWGQVVPEILGRCQVQLIPFSWADKGSHVGYLMAVANGRVESVTDIKSRTEGMSNPICSFANPPASPVIHLGDPGGTGTNNGNTCQADLAGNRVFSKLAYIEGASAGVDANGNIIPLGLDVADQVPIITAVVKGKQVALPDSGGVFTDTGWTNNPTYLTRFILTDPKWLNIAEAFMEDAVNYQTGLFCDYPILDKTGSQLILIPGADVNVAGTQFTRYLTAGRYNPRHILFYEFGDSSIVPELVDGPYDPIALDDDPPDPFVPGDPVYITQHPLIKRFTCNLPVNEEIKGTDLLNKIILPTFNGYIKTNKHGKIEIRAAKPSDATRLRTATSVGATSIPVLDVTPWKTGPDLLLGRVLLGTSLINSEVRTPSAAVFSTSGNSISLTSSGSGITATASGASLSGGSTSVQASGTVTISGTPNAGDSVTVTIDGIAVTYILDSDDTTSTTAAMVRYYINANQRLNKYIRASWDSGSPTVVTITCLHGALTVPALLKAHATALPDPTTAPTASGSSGGSLPAGVYKLGYADTNAIGSTVLTSLASITVTANQKIDVSSVPALVGTNRDFYMSVRANSEEMAYLTSRINNSNFSILTVPDNGGARPPSWNTTAEELIRVAMSFATNSQDVYPAWRASIPVALNAFYIPTTANGHVYQVTTQGTTASTEPSWPTTAGATVSSGSAVFTEAGSTVLNQAGLTRANVIKDSFKWPLGSRQSSVNQIKGNFRSAKNDFALTPFRVNDRAHQAQVKKVYPLDVDLSGVDNENQMTRLGNHLLSKFRDGDWFNALATGPQGLVLEEGDVICSSDGSGGLINIPTRIEDIAISPTHQVSINQARKYSTLMFSDDAAAHKIPIPSTLRFAITKDSIVELIDNFALREADAVIPGMYVAASHEISEEGDWRGWGLYADYGDGYTLIASGDVPASIGTCTTVLDTITDASVFDRTSDVTVLLDYYTASYPQSATELDLLQNPYRNLFLIGNEYIQAADITDNGGGSLTLQTLLRGRFGTDRLQLTHGASERAVFLDGSQAFVPVSVIRLGAEFNYKIVTTNQNVTDASPIPFTWTGGTARIPSPVNLRGRRNGALDLIIQWTRRERWPVGLRDLAGTPLSEEREVYIIEIYDGSTLKRRIRNPDPTIVEKAVWSILHDPQGVISYLS